ncbi:MAG: glycosyltransferase family 2 protein, partial [Treponema sp.]|nr:glycosyltransferase family 2 protein [Treponema sp.]
MSEIYLSILVTTYNIEAYIESTIDSIFSEKIRYPYEILIGDDGSSDKSIEIIKSLRNKYPELIDYYVMPRECDKKYLPIQRASRNRLNLLKHAKGKYLIYLDGD